MTTVVEEKTYDKRDRAIKAAQKVLGEKATEGEDFELKRLETNKRFYWAPLKIEQPKDKDKVYLVDTPQVLGKVVVAGPNVSEVKWENGKVNNELNSHLRVVEKQEDPTLSLGFLGPVPESKEEEDIPEFLQAKNRQPVTAEQKAAALELVTKAKASPDTKAKLDPTLPKNIEPAGLEILAAKAVGKRVKAGSSGEQSSPDSATLRLRSACELYNSLVEKVGLKPRKINTTGFTGRPDAVRALRKLGEGLRAAKETVPPELEKYIQAWAK